MSHKSDLSSDVSSHTEIPFLRWSGSDAFYPLDDLHNGAVQELSSNPPENFRYFDPTPELLDPVLAAGRGNRYTVECIPPLAKKVTFIRDDGWTTCSGEILLPRGRLMVGTRFDLRDMMEMIEDMACWRVYGIGMPDRQGTPAPPPGSILRPEQAGRWRAAGPEELKESRKSSSFGWLHSIRTRRRSLNP